MRVVWLSAAVWQLDAIETYIAQYNPLAAGRVRQRIVRRVKTLGRSPYIGRRGRVEGTRELVITGLPYIVAYRIAGERVQILAVLHGARKWPMAF